MADGGEGFTTKELNKSTWGDYVKFFSEGNGWDHCGCTAYQGFQAPSKVRLWTDKRDWNLEVKHKLLERGLTHGILVYSDDEPVGWCQFGRRSELPIPEAQRKGLLNGAPGWKRMRTPGGEDENPSERVWRITCFCTRKDFAERDVAGTALRAAIDAISNRGGGLAEGYPRALAHNYEVGPGRSWRRHPGPFKVPVEGLGEVDGSGWLYRAMHCGTLGMFHRAGFAAIEQIGAGPRVLMQKLVLPRRPVGSTSERPRRQGVTHVPYAPELRAKAAELLRSGKAAEDVARELGITASGAYRFFAEGEWCWATTKYPYLQSIHTREDVIDAVEGEFARLDRLLTSLSEDDFAVPLLFSEDAIEKWTVQDGLVHVTVGSEAAAQAMAGRRNSRTEREPLETPVGGPTSLSWPRQYPSHMLARPPQPQEVLQWHREVHAHLMRALPRWLESRPVEKLVSPERGVGSFTFHARTHREQMERALLAAGRSIPLDRPPTPQQIVDRMCQSFDDAADPKLRATLQLDVTGRGGGRWWVRIDRGRCQAGEGNLQRPDVVVTTRVQEFVRLRLGETTPTWSASKGTIKIAGPLRLGDALRVLSLFKPDYRWPNL